MSEADEKIIIDDTPAWLAGLENPRETFTLYLHPKARLWADARVKFDRLAEQIKDRDELTEAALGDEDPMLEQLQVLHDQIEEWTPLVKESAREFVFEQSLTTGEINEINRRHIAGRGEDAVFDDDSASIEVLGRAYVGDDMNPAAWRKLQKFVGPAQWMAFSSEVAEWLSGSVIDADFSVPDLPTSREQ